MKIKSFIPYKSETLNVNAILQEVMGKHTIPPFDQRLIDILNEFSLSILFDKHSRLYPELIVLANFFKKTNIEKIKKEFFLVPTNLRVARGLVFHIAPSNVDSVSIYSSLLSLLCGNINLIRISQPKSNQFLYVLDKLSVILNNADNFLANRFFIINYDHDDDITAQISQLCHLRVVWGGDETVKKIRSIPLQPTASEICFPDRFSLSMIKAESLLRLDMNGLEELCLNFYNDSIWFSQQACSSPKLIAWIGNEDICKEARLQFWNVFNNIIKNKTFDNSPSMAIDRFVTACVVACDDAYKETSSLGFPTRLLLKNNSLYNLKKFHNGNGLFYEQNFYSILDFFNSLSAREQTLSIFGFDENEVEKNIVYLPMRAIDRVTKIGKALDFNYIWDGYNLIHSFTRQILFKIS